MTNRNTDYSEKGEGGNLPRPARPPDHSRGSGSNNKVFKSGPLFLSSKGIGWTSWKKRWFILTRTSLVFFRSDPSAIPQKGSEVNLTLGGIDLNNSGSVVVKVDKKLLTVLFPDGRDGRAFTLKAETLEDLYEWKAALEEALALAPSATLVMGQNGIFRNDQADTFDGYVDQLKDRQPVKSLVIGRPILLALEDIDGTPSFLEKALRFVEEHGVKVEGILRQAAYVDDVERRIREYEQGKNDFSSEEDAHVIADCVKYVLRELPSSPVPASCCNALLETRREFFIGVCFNWICSCIELSSSLALVDVPNLSSSYSFFFNNIYFKIIIVFFFKYYL
ncbi:rho GTPase-activating protein REN1-like [Camellia sinensis]|uniref:rho GTPase-activating protein REN1-like n=1 Tax=Camellia sinensis TaxID=4442 RepID=UPI00103597AC|nr:rho GTPase-activating protein REN1-like [Camellia sinensis]XP_028061619.1 rho GTPase-activating protein REN1-like [Camellia sinensis]